MALTNTLEELTIQEIEQLAVSVLLENLGIAILGAELVLPFAFPIFGFVAIGFAIADLVSLFGGGKSVTVDTNNVIRAYNMSAYQPLHSLAADLSEMLKNGAPISDSRPQIQAQFGQLKVGTVESIQALVGAQQGENGDGFWQLFNMIELTWRFAGQYNLVFNTVKAIDAFTIGLSQLEQQTTTPPPPPPPPQPPQTFPGGNIPGGTPGQVNAGSQAPCPPYTAIPRCLPAPPGTDYSTDEIGNLALVLSYWMQIFAIYLANIYEKIGSGSGSGNGGSSNSDPVTCTQLTGLIDNLIAAIQAINISIPPTGPTPEPPPAPDLTPIVTALEQIAAALGNPNGDVAAQVKRIADVMVSDDARGRAVIEYWNGLGLVDPNLAQILLGQSLSSPAPVSSP